MIQPTPARREPATGRLACRASGANHPRPTVLALALVISAIGIPMPPPPGSEVGYMAQIQVVPRELILAFCVGLVATVAAAVFPARRVTQIPVVDALRQNV